MLLLALAAAPASAQEPVYPGFDVGLDTDSLSGFAVAVRGQAPLGVSGEAFRFLGGGWGASAAFVWFFNIHHTARMRATWTTFEELFLSDGRATLAEVSGELLWRRGTARATVEAGPTIGYALLTRSSYRLTQHGVMVGVAVGLGVRLASRWSVVADGVVSWVSVDAPDADLQSPGALPDEGSAFGRRVVFGVGLEYRWRPGPTE